jgi:predicted nicotinamide N-methyase
MEDRIPDEFSPTDDTQSATSQEDTLHTLFSDINENGTDQEYEEATIDGQTYKLKLPPDVGTLFAHRVWSGSRVMADFLVRQKADYVCNKTTVELGAGTALPSLVCLTLGSKACVITDFPDESLLRAIRHGVGTNWQTCGRPTGRVAVVGHLWGEDAANVLAELRLLEGQQDEDVRFDIAILSECLWMHRSHAALASSLDALLHPNHGTAIVTYAHHIPGCEEADDAFFFHCQDRGFVLVHKETHESSYAWDASKSITIHLCVISRTREVAEEI